MRTTIARMLVAAVLAGGFILTAGGAAVPAQAHSSNSTSIPLAVGGAALGLLSDTDSNDW